MSRRKYRKVMHRRAGAAAGALTVMAFAALGSPGSNLVPVAQAQASGTVIGGSFLPGIARAVAVAPPTATPGLGTLSGLDGLPVIGTGPLSTVTGPLSTVTAADVPTPLPATTAVPALVVPPSAPTGTGIPGTVLAAYKAAEASLAASDPACHLPWTLVAGIGRVESGNASGGRVDAAGTTRGRILGPLLDGGLGGTAVVRDTDGGSMDGNAQFDRAVGPMQFLPGTWKTYAKDGNHDGVADPHNVFDAALATGTYLCAGGSDLSQPIPERAALMRYNHSVAYGDLVLRWAAAYAAGVATLPDATGEVPSTAPTPPEQVPAPAADSSNTLALAAVSSSDSDSSDSDTSTTSTSTSETTSTSTTSTTSTSTTSSPTTTPTAPSTTPAPAPPASSTKPTAPSTTPSTPTSTATTTPSRAPSSSSEPDPGSSKSDTPTSDTSKSDTSKSDTPTSDGDSSKADSSKADSSKADSSKADSSKADSSTSGSDSARTASSSTTSSAKAAAKTSAATPSSTKKAAAKTAATKAAATKAEKPDTDTADGDS